MFTRSQAAATRSRSPPGTPSPPLIPARITPGTPGPNEQAHLFRQRARNYPAASPTSRRQAEFYKRQLFQQLPGTPGHSFLSPTPPRPTAPTFRVYRPTMPGSAPPSTASSPSRLTAQQEQHLQNLLCVPTEEQRQQQLLQIQQEQERLQQQQQQLLQQAAPPAGPAASSGPDPPDVHEQLTQMTQVLQNLVQIQHRIVPQAPAIQPTAPPVIEDVNFQWRRLAPPVTHVFPDATTAQIQQLATAMFMKAPLLTGRDKHETDFILSLLSLWDELSPAARKMCYQRLNLLYIATHYGWGVAIETTQVTAQHLAVFPPGYTPQPQPARHFPRYPVEDFRTQQQRARPGRRGAQPRGRPRSQQTQQQ